jgi:hypothetical protein
VIEFSLPEIQDPPSTASRAAKKNRHRAEAARQLGLEENPLVARKLTDEQMLQFMGRENMEDYNADFSAC